jgi:[protein-PII] uridylyltransferase
MDHIRQPRAIIDRRALLVRIAELVETHSDLSARRAPFLAVLKQTLKAGRDEARARLEAGHGGRACAEELSFLVDQIVRIVHDYTVGYVFPLINPTKAERLSLVALGGYGRGELAPGSDVDLLFLLPYKQTPWGEQVVEYMLYLLWDLGFKVGHSTRSVDEAIRLAKSDVTIATATLEARWVWGDQGLFEELKERFRRDVLTGTGATFVEAKLAERAERHRRLGDSRYTVEPNLKEGKGGLRDLHTLWWLAKYLYKIEDVVELVERRVISAAELRTFQKAEAFLWDVRCHLHFLTGRAEERLTFDVQPELARRLGYTDHAGTRGVERFMKHYFLTAKNVGNLTRIFCANFEEQTKAKPRGLARLRNRRKNLDGFVMEGGRLDVVDAEAFERRPTDMLRLFKVAEDAQADIHPHALQLITRSLKRIDAEMRNDPEANRIFLDILTSERDPETTLRRMNEAGVFGRFVPDFGRVVAQMQYDMYHVYTVDEHTIRAIGILSEIERGLLKDDHPLSHEIIHKIQSRRTLYFAVLLHDIAKGRGGDHSELGADVALRLGPRVGLTEAETEEVAWLVRHHLIMSNTAFRRDISDPKTVSDFAAMVQSPERLRLLLILTVADIRAVGPGIWNGWKGQLLRDLYYSTEQVLLGGHAESHRKERVAAVKEALRPRLGDWAPREVQSHLKRAYDSYWLSADLDSLERHARLMRQADREDAPLTLSTRVDRFRSVTEVTLYTADHPGLFARVAGAMSVCGASIVDAKIFTTKDGMALDVFWIQDADGGAFDRPERLARLSTAVEQVLSGRLRPREWLERQTVPSKRTRAFSVAPRVLIDNTASDRHTVIEVNGLDRPGLLFELTRALFTLSLTIASAHIATYGERAVDVFYVSDLFKHKVTHPQKLKRIERRLIEALEGPKPEPAEEAKPEPARPRRAAG